ncbi:hypothetical protein [Antrihabitans cavernicola]|uniref:Uncharacterized protein n=1 Tax=Antrihabitans cavernicola TaxID=2495913 RepID=A0A5A7S3H6_9NOCA|nr:hypothetical protein [Spelaeibacter cavernicola]KAA0015876.1 hypothetical protein FOY51_26930 [Spelaeibacter cavernicola]
MKQTPTLTPTTRHLRTIPATAPPPAVLVAVEALLIRPRADRTRDGARPASVEEPWPIFAVVLADRKAPAVGAARALFDLLDKTKQVTIEQCHYAWSTVDAQRALIRLAVRACAPVPFEVDIVLPAQPVLGILAPPNRDATLAITTSRRADRLRNSVDLRTVLDEVVLLSKPASVGTDGLDALLRRTGAHVHDPR